MSIEQMELRLEKWKGFAWFCLGMSVSLLAASIADVFLYPHGMDGKNYLVWLFLWLPFQTVTATATMVMVWGKDWRLVLKSLRFHTLFKFFTADWIVLLSFGLHLYIQFVLSLGPFIILILLVGVILAGIFLYLRKKYITTPESIFP